LSEILTTQQLEDFLSKWMREDDFEDALDFVQTGKVQKHESHGPLIKSFVSEGGVRPLVVRLKFGENYANVQWYECDCAKNRKENFLCEHIGAALLDLVDKHPEVFGNLNPKAPIRPPSSLGRSAGARFVRRTITGKESSANFTSLLTKSEDHIRKLQSDPTKPGIKVEIMAKGSHETLHLDLDQAATFLRTNPQKNAPTVHGDLTAFRGYVVSEKGDEKVVLEPALIARGFSAKSKSDDLLSMQFYMVGGQETAEKEKLKIYQGKGGKELATLCGNKYAFFPEFGYVPLGTSLGSKKWPSIARKKTLDGDKTASFFMEGYKALLLDGSLCVDPTLPKFGGTLATELVSLEVEEGDSETRKSWFYLSPKYEIGGEAVPMTDLLKHFRKNKRKFFKTKSGWAQIPDLVRSFDWNLDDEQNQIHASPMELFRLRASLGEYNSLVGTANVIKSMQALHDFKTDEKAPELSNTNLNLREYQSEGYQWLWWLYSQGMHGLLADEMGLGKTHQSMAIMSAARSVNNHNHLVVMPTSVIYHWQDRIKEFTPELSPLIYRGGARTKLLDSIKQGGKTVLTSYGVAMRDAEFLKSMEWNCLVLDEVHYIKNAKTNTYGSLAKIPSRFRLGLSGTPIENNLLELRNIFDFLLPGYLGSMDYFKKNFVQPIIKESDEKSEIELMRLLHPFQMRRTKNEVAKDLPDKIEDKMYCELTPEQVTTYNQILSLQASDLVKDLEDEEGGSVSYMHVFAVLGTLKQLVNHPLLINKEGKMKDGQSGKFELFKEVLGQGLASGQKIVVYSQYLKMLDLIGEHLESQGIGYVKLTGKTQKREKVIEKFQNDPETKVYLGSLLAGGIGIDLTSASLVIHYDRWWNASKEDQATDRVHRIGQKNKVHVVKLVTKGTLEEKIDSLIQSKKKLFTKFVDTSGEMFKSFSREEILELLSGIKGPETPAT